MTDRIPRESPEAPLRGTYGQGDFAQSAQRNRFRKDQHYAPKKAGASETPNPYGEGAFAGGTDRQSGYGADFGQLEGAQRAETQVSEQDIKRAGTASKSDR